MKPSLGRTVYCIYRHCIFKDTVYAIGKESFIVASFGGPTYESSWEWKFEDYNTRWFTNIAKAKKALKEKFPGTKIVEVIDGEYWEAYEEGEI